METTKANAAGVLPQATAATRPSWLRGQWRLLTLAAALVLLGGALGAGVVLGIAAWSGGHRSVADAPSTSQEQPSESAESDTLHFELAKQEAIGLETAVATARPLIQHVWRTGRVALHDDRIAHVCPLAEGIVLETPVRLGQTVSAGAVLAVIESRELGQAKLEYHKAQLELTVERELAERTRTAMANAQMLLKLIDAQAPLSEIEQKMADRPIGEWRQQLIAAYARKRQLAALLETQRASIGTIAKANLLQTEAEAETANATLLALLEEMRFRVRDQVRLAEHKLRQAQTNADVARAKLILLGQDPASLEQLDPIAEGVAVSRLTIRAPFAGTVIDKHAVRSERVDPRTQMFLLADLSVVWIQADLYESDLPLLRGLKDKQIVFKSTLAGIPERPATITYAGDLVDPSSRTVRVTAEADNADRLLKPGMFVEVGFAVGSSEPVLQVPTPAILHTNNRPCVFVQVAPERFRRTEVGLGQSSSDSVQIISGLAPGDRVVVKGAFALKSELLKDQLVGE
jgi:cobalt-zinc-cadmium efflux system membrane fusion protein